MSGHAVASAPDPVLALNRLNEIATRYCESQMFFSACGLGIFEDLARGPSTAAGIAQRLGLDPDAATRLMICLAQMGLLSRDGDHFAITPLAAYTTSAAPIPLAPLLAWQGMFQPMWAHLDAAVREGAPRWQQTFGATAQDAFQNMYRDADALRRFCATMSAYSIPQGQMVARSYDFSGHSCILDVAGGPGALILEVGKRHSHLRGIVMDLPPVCAIADEAIAAAGLADRFVSRSADLFAGPYPKGADVISLSWVLHDWNDEHCVQILRNCHAALPDDGALLIVESVLEPDRSGTPFATLMSLHMLILCEPGARERTEAEYGDLLRAAGFRIDRLQRLAAPRDLLIARKA